MVILVIKCTNWTQALWPCSIIGLSFERPYLIKGLNLMIPTFAENRSFWVKNHSFQQKPQKPQKPQFLSKEKPRFLGQKLLFLVENCSFWGKKLVKLTNSFHSRVRTQGEHINFFSQKPQFSEKPQISVENYIYVKQKTIFA